MLAQIITALLSITGFVAAAPVADIPCTPGEYRCDYWGKNVEICDVLGWHVAAACADRTCRVDEHSMIPHCYDS
ncbi:hypothetical protein BDV96DRAFT_686325 [Lophiotrema nucula]|uniref:Extracellular membrane protein CFEM domain-containing protein n=1 Tax=Lophiotrema nucula TaxID=690887 RepID=A0A6A5ZBC4_9PLEO|nr:hypothetical protein BDV96DRAFT_686325 [Lophiotrema nucula]